MEVHEMSIRLLQNTGLQCYTDTVFYFLLTAWNRNRLKKLTGFQMVKKFATFYRTRKLIAAFPSDPPVLIPDQLDPVHILNYHFLNIHLNIILPSTPRSPK